MMPERTSKAPPDGAMAFRWSATGALCLHVVLLFSGPLSGGADLTPHLRLMQQMADAPALRNVYAPAFHAAGALLGSLAGWSLAVELLALAAAATLLFGFRHWQRAAQLPETCASLFAWAPYGFALSWCLPKVEAAGYGLAFFALAWLWQGRYARLALALAATFWIHTGAALFLGLAGGIAALARRDRRALGALALGSALAAPLFASHVASGCSWAQAFLFSAGDYLRSTEGWSSLDALPRIAVLSGPVAVVCALLGARELWTREHAVAWLCIAIVALWSNELWLAPFGTRTTLNLLRGLTLLAVPVACAAGVFVAARPRAAPALLAAVALWAIGSTWLALPGACQRTPVDWERVARTQVDRCSFRWAISEAHGEPVPRPAWEGPDAETQRRQR